MDFSRSCRRTHVLEAVPRPVEQPHALRGALPDPLRRAPGLEAQRVAPPVHQAVQLVEAAEVSLLERRQHLVVDCPLLLKGQGACGQAWVNGLVDRRDASERLRRQVRARGGERERRG